MGMAASQARLLSITARLTDKEFQAQQISNAKVRLATDSEKLNAEYVDSLNQKNIKLVVGFADSTAQYEDLTYNGLVGVNSQLAGDYCLTNTSGNILVTKAQESAFMAATNCDEFIAIMNPQKFVMIEDNSYKSTSLDADHDGNADGNELMEDYEKAVAAFSKSTNGAFLTSYADALTAASSLPADATQAEKQEVYTYMEDCFNAYDADPSRTMADNFITAFKNLRNAPSSVITVSANTSYKFDSDVDKAYYQNLYNKMSKGYTTQSNEDSTINNRKWLENQLQQGTLLLNKFDSTEGWKEISWDTCSELSEQMDESDLAEIKANYDYKLSKIDNQDKKYDLELKQIDTEHTALQTEVESVKKVIDKNIEATFKSFG